MYKDLLVPVVGTPADAHAIDMALKLAAGPQAQLTVLEIVNLPLPPTPWGIPPEIAMTDIYARLRDQAQTRVAQHRERLASEAVSTEVRLLEALFLEPAALAVRSAQTHALSVVGNVLGDNARADQSRAMVSTLLLESGRPVLCVPEQASASLPRHVVVAWKPTAQAARAVHDALPLLQAADTVEVLMIDPVDEEGDADKEPGHAVLAHLRRNGVECRTTVLHTSGTSDSRLLLDHVHQSGAHMLVAGGYGHSRFREWVLGGMTRELLFSSRVPILFSH